MTTHGWAGMQRLFIKNPQFAGKFGSMTQLGGDFILGPGASHTEYHIGCFGPHGYPRSNMHFCVKNATLGRP